MSEAGGRGPQTKPGGTPGWEPHQSDQPDSWRPVPAQRFGEPSIEGGADRRQKNEEEPRRSLFPADADPRSIAADMLRRIGDTQDFSKPDWTRSTPMAPSPVLPYDAPPPPSYGPSLPGSSPASYGQTSYGQTASYGAPASAPAPWAPSPPSPPGPRTSEPAYKTREGERGTAASDIADAVAGRRAAEVGVPSPATVPSRSEPEGQTAPSDEKPEEGREPEPESRARTSEARPVIPTLGERLARRMGRELRRHGDDSAEAALTESALTESGREERSEQPAPPTFSAQVGDPTQRPVVAEAFPTRPRHSRRAAPEQRDAGETGSAKATGGATNSTDGWTGTDVSPPLPPTLADRIDIPAMLAAVRDVPGVRGAELRTRPDGERTLRLELEDSADPATVSNAVARLLEDRLGMTAPPSQIERSATGALGRVRGRDWSGGAHADSDSAQPQSRLGISGTGRHGLEPDVQTSEGASRRRSSYHDSSRASRHSKEATGAESSKGRFRIEQVQVVQAGLECAVEVGLAYNGTRAVGRSAGPAVESQLLRAAAAATLEAVTALLAGRVRGAVEYAGVVSTGHTPVALVVLILMTASTMERHVGAAEVTDEAPHAVVRATLSALNRRLEALVDEQE